MRWTPEKIAEMRAMASAGGTKDDLATHFGVTRRALWEAANRNGIDIPLRSPAEIEMYRERSKLRDRARNARKKAKRSAALAATRAASGVVAPIKRAALTLPQKRLMYAENRDLTKNQLREMCRQAVINTAALQVSP